MGTGLRSELAQRMGENVTSTSELTVKAQQMNSQNTGRIQIFKKTRSPLTPQR